MNRHVKILDIFYGNKCNLACDQCDTRSEHLGKGEYDPTLENIKEGILLANEKFDVENWSVLGGEPFLYIDTVVEILKFLRSIEPNKTIFFPTNGLLLEKNLDLAADLIKEFGVWIQVCNHTAAFKNKKLSNKILNSVYKLAEKTGIPKADPTTQWWYNIMNYDSGTEGWQIYLKTKNIDITNTNPNDAAWIDGNKGIYYMEALNFQSLHYTDPYGNLKPFNSNDPTASYWNSCPSSFCALLYDKKVYKCAALGTIRNLLDKQGQLDDTEWQPYLNYKPVDLVSCTDKEVVQFADTHYCQIDECSMCPSKSIEIIKTEEKVLPIYFKKNERTRI